jgi:hypothetical protein
MKDCVGLGFAEGMRVLCNGVDSAYTIQRPLEWGGFRGAGVILLLLVGVLKSGYKSRLLLVRNVKKSCWRMSKQSMGAGYWVGIPRAGSRDVSWLKWGELFVFCGFSSREFHPTM